MAKDQRRLHVEVLKNTTNQYMREQQKRLHAADVVTFDRSIDGVTLSNGVPDKSPQFHRKHSLAEV